MIKKYTYVGIQIAGFELSPCHHFNWQDLPTSDQTSPNLKTFDSLLALTNLLVAMRSIC